MDCCSSLTLKEDASLNHWYSIFFLRVAYLNIKYNLMRLYGSWKLLSERTIFNIFKKKNKQKTAELSAFLTNQLSAHFLLISLRASHFSFESAAFICQTEQRRKKKKTSRRIRVCQPVSAPQLEVMSKLVLLVDGHMRIVAVCVNTCTGGSRTNDAEWVRFTQIQLHLPPYVLCEMVGSHQIVGQGHKA